jgi:hypothetical protein
MFTTDRLASATAAILEAVDARIPQDDRLRALTPRERVAVLAAAASWLAQHTLGHVPEEQNPELKQAFIAMTMVMATCNPDLIAVLLGRIAFALAAAPEWPQNRGSQFKV